MLDHVVAALDLLRRLPEPPDAGNQPASLKMVRQRRRYTVWRVSHAYHSEVAVRLICWFPPKANMVAVALFAGDKLPISDAWYDSVPSRADPLIDQWKRETSHDGE